MKTRSSFPTLVDLGRAAAVSTSVSNAMTSEQRDCQAELREDFVPDQKRSAGGIIYPWYVADRERRDMTATGGTNLNQGGIVIGNEILDLGTAFRARLVLEQLGARVFGGLKSNVRFTLSGALAAADWVSENAGAPDASFVFRGLDLAPHRLTAYFDVSKQLLLQGLATENHLRGELMAALAEEVQRVAIAGSGANNEPLGILNTTGIGSVVGGTNGAAPDYDDITQLEYLVGAGLDGEKTGWLVSPLARRKLRRTAMFASGSLPIWAADQARALLGHPAGVTTSVPDTLTKGSSVEACSAIVHGEFSELFLGFWGAGIVVEAVPFGGHQSGKVRFLATVYADSGVRGAAAFSAMKDALCAA